MDFSFFPLCVLQFSYECIESLIIVENDQKKKLFIRLKISRYQEETHFYLLLYNCLISIPFSTR